MNADENKQQYGGKKKTIRLWKQKRESRRKNSAVRFRVLETSQ